MAEAIVAVLYVTAGSTLLSLLPMPLYYWLRSPVAYGRLALLMSLLLFGYQGWAYGQLLLGSTLTRLRPTLGPVFLVQTRGRHPPFLNE